MENNITLTIDTGYRDSFDICKRCAKCHLAVFIPKGKDKDNTLLTVEQTFAKYHLECEFSEGIKAEPSL